MPSIFHDEPVQLGQFFRAREAVGRICPLKASQMLESQPDLLALCSFSPTKFDTNAAHAVIVHRP